MTTRRTVAEVVTRIHTAAGRRATDAEFALYAEVTAPLADDVVAEASRRMVEREDWTHRPPSPALLVTYVRLVQAEARARTPAIPSATGPVAASDVVSTAIAEARRALTRGGAHG